MSLFRSPSALIAALACTSALVAPAALAGQQADWSLLSGQSAAKADDKSQDFVAPLTSPYFHEDSFVTNDVRAWYVHHKFGDSVGLAGGGKLPQGGSAQVIAVQARLALTDKLQLVAYKDGYVITRGDTFNQEGWNDLAAGLKYAWLQDHEAQLFSAVGAGVQLPVGDDEVLQKKTELRAWGSVNKGFDQLHLGATVNLRVAGDTKGDNGLGDLGGSTVLSWHAHADYRLTELFSPVVELNGFHVLDDGSQSAANVNVGDITNIGGGKDESLVTGAVGLEYRCPMTGLKVRAAYEVPLTSNNDLFDYRVTTSVIYTF